MAGLAELMVKVGADISDFTSKMTKVNSDLVSAGKTISNTGKSIASAGTKLTTHVTAPLVGLGTIAVATGMKFDAQMSKVSAVSGATGKDFQKLRDQAKELGRTTVWSATEAGQGMEYLARAGWKVDDIYNAMPSMLNLATATATDLGRTADITSDIMQGFAISSTKAGHASDVLALTTARTNTDLELLGDSMKYVAPVAHSLGLSIEETSAALGIMANAGIKGSQGGTALRAGLIRLVKPTKMAKTAMKTLGVTFFDAEGNMKPMRTIIGDLTKATKGMTTEQKSQTLAMLFGQEAVSGWLALVDAGPEALANLEDELINSEGATDRMAETMRNNLWGAMKGLTSALEGLAISFSDVMTPAIQKVTDWLTNLTQKFTETDDGTKKMILAIAGIVASIGPALIIIGKLGQGVGALVTVFGTLGGPVTAVIAVIALLVAGFVMAYQKIEPFREMVNRTFSAIKDIITKAVSVVVSFLQEKLAMIQQFWQENGQQILQAIHNVWDFIEPIISVAMKLVLLVIQQVWEAIKNVINGALNIIMGLIKVFAGLFTGDFSKMWEGVKQLFMGAVEFLWGLMNLSFYGKIIKVVKNLVKAFVNLIKGQWENIQILFMYGKDKVVSILESLKGLASKIWNAIKDAVVKIVKAWWNQVKDNFNTMKAGLEVIWNAIKSVATSVWNAIKSGIQGIVNGIKAVIETVWNAIKSTTSTIFNGIKSTTTSIWNGIKSTIDSVVNGVKSTVTNVWNGIKSTTSSVFNGIKSTATSVWNGIKTAITHPIESAKSTVLGIIDAIKGAFSRMKITIPKPKLPKISVAMKKGVMGIPYPSFNVSWNKKGAIFNGATLLGGGQGVGEAGAEAVLPIQHKRYMQPFAKAVAENMNDLKSNKDNKVVVENVVYTTIELDGEVVGRKVERYVSEKQGARQDRNRRIGGRR